MADRIASIRITTLDPTDWTVLLRHDERIVNVHPHYQPDGIYLDVFVVSDPADRPSHDS